MSNVVRKLVLLFIFGIMVFFINGSDAYAFSDGQVLCRYSGDWGTIEFKAKVSNKKVSVISAFTKNKEKCTMAEPCNAASMEGALLGTEISIDQTLYPLNLSDDGHTYTCPTLYYDYEEKCYEYVKDIFDLSHLGYSCYNNYKMSYGSINEYGHPGSVNSSVGPQSKSAIEGKQAKCDDAKDKEFAKLYKNEKSNYGIVCYNAKSSVNNININKEEAKEQIKAVGDTQLNKLKEAYNSSMDKLKEFDVTNQCVASEHDDKMSDLTSVHIKCIKELTDAIDKKNDELKNAKKIDEEELEKRKKEAEEKEKKAKKESTERMREYQAIPGLPDIDYNEDAISCNELLGSDVLDDIREIFGWIKIIVPILVIVLGSLDFAKAVFLDDDKALSKATSTFIKRLIAAVALFFAPFIIMFILETINKSGCDVTEIAEVIIKWKM